jgi:hypothetical protein
MLTAGADFPCFPLMSSLGLRPSFSHVVDLRTEDARAMLVAAALSDGGCEVRSFPGFICLRVPLEERRFWSPRLHVSLEFETGESTRIQGTYGPNASMWSFFLYGYLLIGSLGLFSGILGYCQWSLGMAAWALWIFWVMLAAAVAMYLFGQFGKKLAASQTRTLHRIYEQAVGCRVDFL